MLVALRNLVVASLLTGLVLAGSSLGARASSSVSAKTCTGGPIAGGTYTSLTIAGVCALNAGDVNVLGNVTLLPGSALVGAFHSGSLSAGGNLAVGSDAILVLGCEPDAFPCLDDPNAVPSPFGGLTGGTLFSHDSVQNLAAIGALAVLVHNDAIRSNLVLQGGGGGVRCAPTIFGFPAYGTFEDNTIGANASVTGWRSCWLGFIRNQVTSNVTYSDNVVADLDGNEVVTNTIGANLVCEGNSPAPQVGDSGGSLNTVGGTASGQCAALAT